MRIKIVQLPDGSAPVEYRRALVGLTVEALSVVEVRPPKPNTNGRAYEVESERLTKALTDAGHKDAARYYGNMNPFPALQWIGVLIPTGAAEAA